MENRKIKTELLNKYIGQEKELLDFIKADKEVFERILGRVEIDKYLGYYTAEFYIDKDSCDDLFETAMKEICGADIDGKFQGHLLDLLNSLEPASIEFRLTENEMAVKDIFLEGRKEWDFEISLLKPIDYIFENCTASEVGREDYCERIKD